MQHYPADAVLDAARTIRPLLPRLLDADDVAWVDEELSNLLGQAEAGEEVDTAVQRLLAKRSPTREWIRFYLGPGPATDPEPVRSYAGPPGWISALPAQQYACPTEACFVRWRCRAAGQQAPTCPTHGVDLVPSSG